MHPDHDIPERHLASRPFAPVTSLLPRRRLTADELRRLEAAIRQIEHDDARKAR